jgi:hypothetical protein
MNDVNTVFKKHPEYLKILKTKDLSESDINALKYILIENKNIISQYPIVLKNEQNIHNFIQFGNKIIQEHKIHQIVNKHFGKNKDLISNDIMNQIFWLYKKNNDEKLWESFFFKYVNSYKSSYDVIKNLNELSLYLIEKNNIQETIEGFEYVEDTEKNLYIIKINNYHEIMEIGSLAWCIVFDVDQYTDYEDKGYQHFVIIDNNKNKKDVLSKVCVSTMSGQIVEGTDLVNHSLNSRLRDDYKELLKKYFNIVDINIEKKKKLIDLLSEDDKKYLKKINFRMKLLNIMSKSKINFIKNIFFMMGYNLLNPILIKIIKNVDYDNLRRLDTEILNRQLKDMESVYSYVVDPNIKFPYDFYSHLMNKKVSNYDNKNKIFESCVTLCGMILVAIPVVMVIYYDIINP